MSFILIPLFSAYDWFVDLFKKKKEVDVYKIITCAEFCGGELSADAVTVLMCIQIDLPIAVQELIRRQLNSGTTRQAIGNCVGVVRSYKFDVNTRVRLHSHSGRPVFYVYGTNSPVVSEVIDHLRKIAPGIEIHNEPWEG